MTKENRIEFGVSDFRVDDFDYNKSRKSEKLVIRPGKIDRYIDRYFILIVPIMLLLCSILGIYSSITIDTPPYSIKNIIIFIIIFLLGVWLTYLSIRSIEIGQKFFRLKASPNYELNRQTAVDAVSELSWKIFMNTDDMLIAKTNATFLSWGQFIIILYGTDKILICCDNCSGMGKPKPPLLFYMHRMRINQFHDEFSRILDLNTK